MTQQPTHFSTTPTKTTSQVDYILLDGSSSMQDKWWDTLDAIQAYIDGVKAANIHSHCTVQVFDTNDLEYIARDCKIEDWVALRTEPIGAHWGMTPLYDAIAIMAARLRDLDPPRASVVIVTDGEENLSRFTDLPQAKAFLDWIRAKGWQVTFIGADFNNSDQAQALGANEHTSIGVEKRQLSNAAAALARKRARYGLYGDPMHYTDEERQQFGGYLGGPARG
jgi:hypothetical protein